MERIYSDPFENAIARQIRRQLTPTILQQLHADKCIPDRVSINAVISTAVRTFRHRTSQHRKYEQFLFDTRNYQFTCEERLRDYEKIMYECIDLVLLQFHPRSQQQQQHERVSPPPNRCRRRDEARHTTVIIPHSLIANAVQQALKEAFQPNLASQVICKLNSATAAEDRNRLSSSSRCCSSVGTPGQQPSLRSGQHHQQQPQLKERVPSVIPVDHVPSQRQLPVAVAVAAVAVPPPDDELLPVSPPVLENQSVAPEDSQFNVPFAESDIVSTTVCPESPVPDDSPVVVALLVAFDFLAACSSVVVLAACQPPVVSLHDMSMTPFPAPDFCRYAVFVSVHAAPSCLFLGCVPFLARLASLLSYRIGIGGIRCYSPCHPFLDVV